MTKLPQTPPSVADLRDSDPEIRTLAEGSLLVRIYFRGGNHPSTSNEFRRFGPVNARFDHHPEPTRLHPKHAIYYAAEQLTTCIAETFQDTRLVNVVRRRPAIVSFELARQIELLDLTGSWPTRAGASMNINSGPRAAARAWSRQFHLAFPDVDGIYYCSSMHANQPSIALYERARDALPTTPLDDRLLDDPLLLGDLKRSANELGYGLILV